MVFPEPPFGLITSVVLALIPWSSLRPAPAAGLLTTALRRENNGMDELCRSSALLRLKGERTVAVAESAAGGLIPPPAGGAGRLGVLPGRVVIYTRQAWDALRDFDDALLGGTARPPAKRLIRRAWPGIASGRPGAWARRRRGPTGNRYGDPAGHAWLAVSGRRKNPSR